MERVVAVFRFCLGVFEVCLLPQAVSGFEPVIISHLLMNSPYPMPVHTFWDATPLPCEGPQCCASLGQRAYGDAVDLRRIQQL